MIDRHKRCGHGRRQDNCAQCGGSQVCPHKRRRRDCADCTSECVCEHGRKYRRCKKCGTYDLLRAGGFTLDEIKTIGAVNHCQFPGCLVQGTLNSDHAHDGMNINRDNYRGELCQGHNRLLADLDQHPEWADKSATEYMSRRPFQKRKAAGR